MKLILISLITAFSGALFADDCSYQISKNDVRVEWTAFKTPSKAGVGGGFNKLGLEKDVYAAKSASAALRGAKFAIDTSSVDTKNPGRDAKIAKFFFQNVKKIKGTVLVSDQDSMVLELEMNGEKVKVPMTIEASEKSLKANGVLDIMDFGMNEHLAALNKACFELHQGKTWSDVEVALKAKLQKNCE